MAAPHSMIMMSRHPHCRLLDHKFSISDKQSVLLDLAYCHDSLSEDSDAKAVAKQIIALNPNSGPALHAQGLLIELATDDPRRLDKLRAFERRARKEEQTVAAGNAALILAEQARGDVEEVRKILAPLIDSKKSTDFYNQTRAVVKLAELSLKRGEPLNDAERVNLVRAYHFVFNEQMPNLFDRCHDALWRDFSKRNELQNLLILFRHSSLRWRLRGQDSKERKYVDRLKAIGNERLLGSAKTNEKEFAYYVGRENFYRKQTALTAPAS